MTTKGKENNTGGAMRKVGLRVVLCTGMKRSASTWSYNVCRKLLEREARMRGFTFVSDYSNDTDIAISNAISNVNSMPTSMILLFKSHTPGPKTRELIGAGRIANIFTLRDPRDALASMIKFRPEDGGIEQKINVSKQNLLLAEEFAAGNNSLIVRYEQMMADSRTAIQSIARYLKCELTDEELHEIERTTSIEESRKIADAVPAPKKPGGPSLLHRETMLHSNHIQGGTIGRWRDELSPDLQHRLDSELGHWLALFGYDRAA